MTQGGATVFAAGFESQSLFETVEVETVACAYEKGGDWAVPCLFLATEQRSSGISSFSPLNRLFWLR